MWVRSISLVCIITLAAMLQFECGRGPTVSGSAAIGEAAPSFRLPDLQGRSVSLDQFRGKVVLVDFWATWCGPCRMSMPLLERLQHEFAEEMVLLAVNLQEPLDEVQSYVQQRKIGSIVLLDANGDVGMAYGSESIPMQVLIDRQGILRHILVGYHSRMDEELRSEIRKLIATD